MEDVRFEQMRREREAREEEEDRLRDLGRSMRQLLGHERWDDLPELERKNRVEGAHQAATKAMGIEHPTTIEWTDDDSDGGAGFDETRGVIEIPSHHLRETSADTFAGLLGHEVRHAWQWDVIEGRIDPPGGAAQRDWYKLAYDAYDSEDRFKYATNELEQDANDRASYVLEGFREAS